MSGVVGREGMPQHIGNPREHAAGAVQSSPAFDPVSGTDGRIGVLSGGEAAQPVKKGRMHAHTTRAARFALGSVQGDGARMEVNAAPGKAGNFCGTYSSPEHDADGGGADTVLRQQGGIQQACNLIQRERGYFVLNWGSFLKREDRVLPDPTAAATIGKESMQNGASFEATTFSWEVFFEDFVAHA